MTITKNLSDITNRIEKAAQQAQRDPHAITLLAVSKTWPAEKLRALAEAGQKHFGENYLQEALQKISALKSFDLIWHFIGPIQSNKTKDIAEQFSWVHSVDRLKIAQRLNAQRPSALPPLNICIQLNIDDETTKSGIKPDALLSFAQSLEPLDNLILRGIMVIPSNTDDPEQQRRSFQHALNHYQRLKDHYPNIDTLSMGMSKDMELAITHGSTIVRVGTALFGKRTTPKPTATVK